MFGRFSEANLPQDVMCDFSRDEENVRHVKEHHSEIARETFGKAAKMNFHAVSGFECPSVLLLLLKWALKILYLVEMPQDFECSHQHRSTLNSMHHIG